MPYTIEETSTWETNLEIPGPGDPVAVGAGSYMRAALQRIFNRTKYLRTRIDTGGVNAIRAVADVAELKALQSPVLGEVAILDGAQFYFFKPGALVGSDLDGYRYDSTSATGYWANPLYYATTGAGAAMRLDVSVLPPPNRIVQLVDLVEGSPTTRSVDSANLWQDSGFVTGNIPLAVGDKVSLRFTSSLSAGEAIDVKVRLSVTAPSGSAGLDGSEVVVDALASSKRMAVATQGLFTATEAGNHVFKVQLYAPLSGGPYTAYLHAHRSLQGFVMRP